MFPFFIKVNLYLFYNFAVSNQPYITMLNGHGDDSYRYDRKITLNFSSNVYHHTSLAPLFRHLENCWEQVRSYPEPSPHAVESQLAQAMGISAESVCLTSGATEAIYLIAQTFSGRRFLHPVPHVFGIRGCLPPARPSGTVHLYHRPSAGGCGHRVDLQSEQPDRGRPSPRRDETAGRAASGHPVRHRPKL